jgi:hypothetical protein
MGSKTATKPQRRATQIKKNLERESDDFVSVARRLGADEDKGRFERKLGKIARAKPKEA